MRAAPYLLCIVAAICGCDALNKPKADNPVLDPPPPRVSQLGDSYGAGLGPDHPQYPKSASLEVEAGQSSGDVRPIAYVDELDHLSDNTVVATVNGVPIFAGEVLERFAARMPELSESMTAQQLHKWKLDAIRHDLNGHIERKLLAEALRADLKPDQIEALDATIDAVFAEQMEKMKQELKVHSRHELELEAHKQGTSLAQLRDTFATQIMAQEYLRGESKLPSALGRQELLAYYRENIEKYSFPAQVRWQQIVVSFKPNGGRPQALKKLEQAIAELRGGADFADVARRYSDGTRAAAGGQFDWTKAGSLADANVEKTLFRLEPNTISSIIEGEQDFKLVKVNQRREAGQTPFAEVQDEIKQTLEQQQQRAASKAAVAELHAKATIKSIFDAERDATQ